MNNLVIIKSSVSDLNLFKSSLNNNSKFIIYNDNTLESEVLNEIDSNITNVAFVWHFPGYYSMPFFDDGLDENYFPIKQNQPYMSNRFYQLIQDIKTKIGQSYKLDFLSCDLRENDFINAMNNYENTLGINIRFSIDRTGNAGGNWILESDGANIKDQYFTSNIDNWNHVLATGYTGSAVTSTISTDIVYNAGTKTYTLQNNITIDNDTYYIEISGNEVFDGQGYKITLTGNIAGLFAFTNADSSANMGTVKNLSIEHNSTMTTLSGIFVRQQQRYFRVVNCDSSGTIDGFSGTGGICGQNAASSNGSTTNGYFEIERCFSTGNISATYNAGGIVGLYGRRGKVLKCYSTGILTSWYGGCICGNVAGEGGGNVDIIDCYATGIINSDQLQGAICGATAGGSGGRVNIYNCYYVTSPGTSTSSTGAIAGGYSGTSGGSCYVYQSFHNTSFNMFGSSSSAIYYNNTAVSNTYKSNYVGEIDYPNLDPSFTPLSSWVFTTTSSGDLPVLTTTLSNANAGTILSNMNSYITPNSNYKTNFKTFFQENSYNLSSQIYTTTLGDISGFLTTISSQPDINNSTVVKILSEEKYGTYTMDNSLVTSLKTGQLFYLPGFNGETITLKIGANSYVLTFGNSGFTYNATSYGLDSEFSLGTDIGFKVRFLGSGGLLGGEPTGGGGIGDPFIKPIFGNSYYLPNDESTYLLFDNKDNLKLYTKTWFAPDVIKMSFMRYLIFEFNDNRACFDLETFKWFKIDDQAKYLSHSLDVELGDLLFGKLKITNKNKKPIRDYYGKRFAPSIDNKVIEIEFFLEKQNIKLEIISDLKYKDIRNNVNFVINGSIDRETLTKYNGSFISEYNVRKVNNNVFFNKNIKLY